MAYSKQNFTKGMILTHEHLNHMEDAIYTLSEGGTVQDTTTWYTDFTSTDLSTACNNNSNGWSYSLDADLALIRGVPINLAKFCTDSTSGIVKLGIAASKGATTISKIVTGEFTKTSTDKEVVTVRLSETITLGDAEYLIIEPFIEATDAFSSKEGAYTFYFGNVDGHSAFLSRIPVDLDASGANPWRANTSACIGWSFGYTTAATGTGDGLDSGTSVEIDIDQEMSATSENPVANKVIKSYVDAETSLRGAEYFAYDFINTDNLDASKLSGGYSESHLTLGKGYALQSHASKLKFNHNIDIDYVKIIADVELTDTTAVLALGSKSYNSTQHASCVTYNFSTGKMIFAKKGNQDSISSAHKTVDISSIITETDTRYYLEIGRHRRQIYAAVTNYRTGARIEATVEESGSNLIYPAGWLYDEPTASQLSGSQAYLRNIKCYVPTDVKVVFIGDSITEGYGTKSDECWAVLCCDYFGNSVNMGRSGATLPVHSQKQIDELLPIVKPKYVVVTIGTNGGNTASNLAKMVESIKALNAVPIVNHIYRKTTDVTSVNNDIAALNTLGARFDYATSIDNDLTKAQDTSLFISDKLHLNVTGNKRVFERFIADCGFINFLK